MWDSVSSAEILKSSSMSLHAVKPTAEEIESPLTIRMPLETPNPAAKLALVLPTLREADNIRAVLDRIRQSLNPLGFAYEILVVDDDSGDGIESIVQEISREDPRVRLLVRKGERGLGGAVLYGWKHTDAEVLGVIDADLQHPPELLPRLWETIDAGSDVVSRQPVCAAGRLGELASGAAPAIAHGHLADVSAAKARNLCTGSDGWILHGAAVVLERHRTAQSGIQDPAGNPGARQRAFGERDSLHLRTAAGGDQQGQHPGRARLFRLAVPALEEPLILSLMFRTRFKKEIVCEFLPPARAGKKQRVIVLCDGMPSIPRKQGLASFLAAKGYWVFYPRYRGAWESDGEFLKTSPHLDILDVIGELRQDVREVTFGKEVPGEGG